MFPHIQQGWEELSLADSRYAALEEAYTKRDEEVKQKIDPIEQSQGLSEIAPVKNKIIDIKEYQVHCSISEDSTADYLYWRYRISVHTSPDRALLN